MLGMRSLGWCLFMGDVWVSVPPHKKCIDWKFIIPKVDLNLVLGHVRWIFICEKCIFKTHLG